ncbi:hypothetical protein HMPREF1084_03215 [Clostridium butyricum 60E.3]|uniref:Uncharacterized protein n=1 Tax=Clostridium butyricum TaxID=1492 RepID=A0A6N2ZQP1_CLOBU|nr:hypothetical protein HMPREF1084_03215 [Clostridium butyricum 60E.3]
MDFYMDKNYCINMFKRELVKSESVIFYKYEL